MYLPQDLQGECQAECDVDIAAIRKIWCEVPPVTARLPSTVEWSLPSVADTESRLSRPVNVPPPSCS